MDWTPLQSLPAPVLLVAAAIAALALLAKNLQSIAKISRAFVSWLKAEHHDAPILLSYRESRSPPSPEWAGPRSAETSPMLLDITISYEGSDTLLFDRLDVRHWAGRLLSTGTGALVSKTKYQFAFSYNTHSKHALSPPLVLDPGAESLLRFQIELLPEGLFPSTGGRRYQKLYYRTGKGRPGVLPLITFDAKAYRDYPDIIPALLKKGRFDYPVFESTDPGSVESFPLTRNGAVRGKVVKRSSVE